MSKKTIKCIKTGVVAGAVYGIFRYLLPLAAPFLFAWLTALVLKPSASAIAGRCRIRWRNRTYGIPAGVAGVLELAAVTAAAAGLLYLGSRILYQELSLLAERLPWWTEQIDRYLTGACRKLEGALSLKQDAIVCMVRDMIRSLGDTLKQGFMPYIMGNTVHIARSCIDLFIVTILYFVGVLLFLQEMDMWKEKMEASIYHQEFARVIGLLRRAGNAYVRTQGIIMVLTTVICMAGFFLLGNPYYILAAAGTGLVDALPVFGTGTVLIPWALFCFFRGQWGRGMAVLGIYGACYLLREILEARLMGDRVGLTPLETLASIYGGLQLFGLLGFLLGPVGLLIIKEFGSEGGN